MNRYEFETSYLNEWSHPEPTSPEDYIAQYVIPEYDLYYEHHSDMWEYVKQRLRWQIFEKLGEEILSGPTVVRGQYVTWNKFDTFEKVIQLRVQLQKVQTMNIVMPKWEPVEVYQGHKVEVKLLCAACGNVWHEDRHGACDSCGSPANWSIK